MTMNERDLLSQPAWTGEELGTPLPQSTHAVSVALPRWQDVIGYEEKKPEVVNRLQAGYPRFVIHPLVQQVAQQLGGNQPCLPFPSLHVAELCVKFIHEHTGENANVQAGRHGSPIHAVVTTHAGQPALRAFWQHTGLIVSTRQAEAYLNGAPVIEDHQVRESLRQQIAALYGCAAHDVFLTPSGMAAQYAGFRAALRRTPGRRTVQLGFPYVDTFKIQEKFGYGAILLHDLPSIASELEHLLKREPLAACFCEIPGNPLLGSADVRTLSPLLRSHHVPLIADDVIGTPFNIDLSGHADLIATSFTKYIAGTGDVMGGALICNPRSPLYHELKGHVEAGHEELLWGGDAAIIDAQAHTFPERMARHNATGLALAERLKAHPAIERVWYPKWEFADQYEAVRKPGGGWGSLLTFLPRNAAQTAPAIYDALAVCKGPSLGTRFTLACPFTLLAHYTELEWAEACGVPRNLIRLSVGLEDVEDLWARLEKALQHGIAS
jgi:cystathionine gamma-synthase